MSAFLKLSLLSRYAFLAGTLALSLALVLFLDNAVGRMIFGLSVALLIVGIYDLVQKRHSITRNYPILGHARFMIEAVRPELRQYLFETDFEKLPFSRTQRALVYARAKNEPDQRPFGTILDTYLSGYEFMGHSVRPVPVPDPSSFRVTIGNDQCRQPYSGSVFNISAMSFGALSANAVMALNKGAKIGGFAQDTGEGSISPYHREHGGDLIWQIASGYFGCRNADGSFSPEKFAKQAADDQVKMIELKLSQGAKPGHGGVLPAHKVSAEIAETRGIPVGRECVSPAWHSSFSTPVEMVEFLGKLRELSGGKPVGFKLAVGQPWEFMSIVKAMLQTGIVPDFVVVDGSEGGTGAAPVEFSDHVGMPMREALLFVHNTLVGTGLRDRIRIGVAGKIVSAFDVVCALAIGADWVNSARGFMFALGCIQSQSCHTNKCPTGIATQDALRQRAIVVPDKAERIASFHRNTMHALADLISAAGLDHPSALRPHHLARRTNTTDFKLFSQLLTYLKPGELLESDVANELYASSWKLAQAESFDAARGDTAQ
ncbi:FMN-binding glutamate synthase family protein [Pararhizobium sp. BT-229]|uniref:FMN-binding glutamate synthase family protein n=1 Tax=Pararhizobium sp. BT-229 TaxID=2986923 RepID=UPI0021F705C5|nr:FMN-binding glutamate synthase family protein [Pararhizobium sp. BT-229]MCV9964240.1 FMN-binding glutamate synthase family protein [Pararhizobium sp. BT-229]